MVTTPPRCGAKWPLHPALGGMDAEGTFQMPYFVYILKNADGSRYYKGSSDDVLARLSEHNAGRVGSTKAYRPWSVHYVEPWNDKTEALKRERFFKTLSGYRWLKRKGIR